MMDMEKEGLGAAANEAIANAATANVNAAIEVASSAVTAFVDSLAGRKKTRGGKKRSSKTRAATVSKRGMAKASPKEAVHFCLPEGSKATFAAVHFCVPEGSKATFA